MSHIAHMSYVPHMNVSCHSNAVWAHATTGQGYTQLFLAVEAEALNRGLASFSPQDLANMVWAFGKVFLARMNESYPHINASLSMCCMMVGGLY